MISDMADSSSLSDSSTSSSDYSDIEELLECEAPESRGQPFTGIQPWRFEPPGRSHEADEVGSTKERNPESGNGNGITETETESRKRKRKRIRNL